MPKAPLSGHHPWPQPSAEAKYGQRYRSAVPGPVPRSGGHCPRDAFRKRRHLGPTAESLRRSPRLSAFGSRAKASGEAHDYVAEGLQNARIHGSISSWRLLAPSSPMPLACQGQCQSEAVALRQWDDREATHSVTVGLVKIGSLALEHGGPAMLDFALTALRRARAAGTVRSLRWWLRRYASHTSELIERGGSKDLAAIASADPEGWRQAFLDALPTASGVDRSVLLEALATIRKSTNDSCAGLACRAQISLKLDANWYFGKLQDSSFDPSEPLEIRRGSWHGTRGWRLIASEREPFSGFSLLMRMRHSHATWSWTRCGRTQTPRLRSTA